MPGTNLFTLPRELRDEIWDLAIPAHEITVDGVFMIQHFNIRNPNRPIVTGNSAPSLRGRGLNLLFISRDVHSEVLSVLWKKTTLKTDSLPHLLTLLYHIGGRNAALIESIDLSLKMGTHPINFRSPRYPEIAMAGVAFPMLQGLRQLKLTVRFDDYYGLDECLKDWERDDGPFGPQQVFRPLTRFQSLRTVTVRVLHSGFLRLRLRTGNQVESQEYPSRLTLEQNLLEMLDPKQRSQKGETGKSRDLGCIR